MRPHHTSGWPGLSGTKRVSYSIVIGLARWLSSKGSPTIPLTFRLTPVFPREDYTMELRTGLWKENYQKTAGQLLLTAQPMPINRFRAKLMRFHLAGFPQTNVERAICILRFAYQTLPLRLASATYPGSLTGFARRRYFKVERAVSFVGKRKTAGNIM